MTLSRRVPLRRSTGPKRSQRLRPVSPKRSKVNRERRANVIGAFGERPRCGACGPLGMVGVSQTTTGCLGWAEDCHERLSRARSGRDENLTDTDGHVPVSRACHSFLTEHPALAEAAGLALPSEPVTQPLIVRDPRTGEPASSAVRSITRVVSIAGDPRASGTRLEGQ